MIDEAVHCPAKPFGAEWLIILSSLQHAFVAATAYERFMGPSCHPASMLLAETTLDKLIVLTDRNLFVETGSSFTKSGKTPRFRRA